MYTYARCNSLLKNNIDVTPELVSESVIMGNACVKELFSDTSRYASTMLTSGENYSPSILAQSLFDLGQDFNNFYQQINVTEASGDEKKTLLAMVKVVMLILKDGLKLLGITTVDEM
jgi:arginyl-tRNA synthetase